MKRVYGRFCSRHCEAVNFYKDLLTKDKRFKAFIKVSLSDSCLVGPSERNVVNFVASPSPLNSGGFFSGSSNMLA